MCGAGRGAVHVADGSFVQFAFAAAIYCARAKSGGRPCAVVPAILARAAPNETFHWTDITVVRVQFAVGGRLARRRQ